MHYGRCITMVYYSKGSNEIVPTSARTPMSPPSDVGNVLFWMSTVLARVIFGYFGCQPCPNSVISNIILATFLAKYCLPACLEYLLIT